MMSNDEFLDACDPWLPAEWDRSMFAMIAPHVQPRLVTFSDVSGVVDFIFTGVEYDDASWEKVMTTDIAGPLLDAAIARYAALENWHAEELKSVLEEVMEPFGLKLGKAQAPVRVAVTGRTVGPPLFESLEVLGQQETLERMRVARSRIST